MFSVAKIGYSSTQSDVLEGSAFVVRSSFGDPIALFVEVSPGMIREYSVAMDKASGKDEFADAAKQYGLLPPVVIDIDV